MWVCVYLVAALYVAGSSACGGCSVDPSKTKETLCSPSTEEFLELVHEDFTMTESCDLITKGKKNWKIPVDSVELTVWGHVGEKNISYHYGNLCEALKGENAHHVEHSVKMFDIPTCNDSVNGRKEVRERKMRHHHRDRLSTHYSGRYEIEIKFEKINGNEADSACLSLEGEIVCVGKE